MKLIKPTSIALIALFTLSLHVNAQKNFAKDADKAFDNKEYFNAIELYKSAYSKTKDKEAKAEILFKTAECYRMIGDNKQAEVWYGKTIKAKYSDPKATLYLANAKKAMGKYDEALIVYNDYKKLNPGDPAGENGAKSCEQAQKWKDHPTRYKVELMPMINSKEADFSPSYADKKYTTLYFTSTREGVVGGSGIDDGTGDMFSDIFETKVDKNGKWSTPVPIAQPVNSNFNDGSSVINKKISTIYFTRCNVEKNAVVPCQLYVATKKGNLWGEPVKITFCTDSFEFRHPAISADESVLIFTSTMEEGSMGGYDLWMSTFNKKTKVWDAPVNLGPEINTAGNEGYPFIRDDGTLFFSSDGHPGMGGLDIFKAEKKGDNKWGTVTNMQNPINSSADDFGIIFEGKKDRGYLSSNREGGKGQDDIYSFANPPLIFNIQGTVKDKETKVPIENATVKLVGSDGSSVELKTDKAGFYNFGANGSTRYVVENTSYVITAGANEYLNSEKAKETTVGVTESKTFVHDFLLQPARKDIFIRFPDVLYDLGKADLRPESKDSLNFLYQTLIDNPTIKIELSSHTDTRADDNFNQKLSEARAKSCVDYLISKGIAPERLVPKGYGEKKVLVTDAEIAKLPTNEEKEAAHQKNRRTVFRVLSFDYVDPNAPKDLPKQKINIKVAGQEEGYEEETEEAPEEAPAPTTTPNTTIAAPQNPQKPK
jgi:peptidoglycan-associated lipoprotein